MKKVADGLNWVTSLGGHAHPNVTRFLRYATSSGLAVTIDFLLLIAFVELIVIFYLTSASMSFVVAHTVNFSINRKWGFKDSTASIGHAYPRFIGFGILSLGMTIGFLWLIVTYAGFHYLLSRALVALVMGVFNFTMNYKFSFKM